MLATLVIVVWDHLLTLSDEVKYLWKREKRWGKSRRTPSQNEIFEIVQASGFLSRFAFVELTTSSGC